MVLVRVFLLLWLANLLWLVVSPAFSDEMSARPTPVVTAEACEARWANGDSKRYPKRSKRAYIITCMFGKL